MIIKICGMTRQEDTSFCAGNGADWLGFIFHPQSPRYIDPRKAALLETGPVKRVGVFVNHDLDEIRSIMKTAGLDLAQLHGPYPQGFGMALGREKVMRVIWPQRYDSLETLADDLAAYSRESSYLLLDAGSEGGGHGQKIGLNILQKIAVPIPWLLAGGLSATAIPEIRRAGLFNLAGFDFNSGVESAPGIKDHQAVSEALKAAALFKNNQH